MKKRLLCLFLALVTVLTLCPAASADTDALQISDSLVTFIKNGEGFRAAVYAGPGGWYIGYGCSCSPADYPNGITEPEAEALLRERMESFAASVRSFLKKNGATVTQQQFDAMCAMSYALGPAWLNTSNTLPGYIVNGAENYTAQQIASAFGAWCHVGGTPSVPALERRIMEAKIFIDGDYSNSADGWCWLILDPDGGKNARSDVAVYKAGEPYGTLPEANREGYTLAGWQTADGRMLTETDTVTESLSLKAVWTQDGAAAEEPTEPEPEEQTTEEQPPAVSCIFADVVKDAPWCAEYVNTLVAQGVVHGYPDGTFKPNNSVTWGEALTLILLAVGYSQQTAPAAENGETVHWAQGYLNFAEKKGFLAKGAVTDLDKPVLRDDVADLCAAALTLRAPSGMVSPFADSSRGSVLALFNAGILAGSFDEAGNRLYKGGDTLRRSEICSILIHVPDYVKRTFVILNNTLIPIDYSLRPSPYDESCFYTKNGRVYYDDGVTKARYGIDVSYYQGDVDWKAVAADGIEFVMIRSGYRGSSSGALIEDSKFRDYITGASKAGLDVGVYFFSQATTVEEAKEEAAYILSQIRGYRITFPVVFDWEPITSSSSRTRYYDGKTLTDCTVAFCDAVAAAGYTPMTYFNKSLAYTKLDLHRLQNYAGWYAYYHEKPDYIYDYQMWQYGSSGTVRGIAGNVDMNIAFMG